jgi:hypothetical protein
MVLSGWWSSPSLVVTNTSLRIISRQRNPLLTNLPLSKKKPRRNGYCDFLAYSSMPNEMKGGDESLTGDVWLADLNSSSKRQITSGGGYRWPLALPGGVKSAELNQRGLPRQRRKIFEAALAASSIA